MDAFGFSPSHKAPPRKGRRAANASSGSNVTAEDATNSDEIESPKSNSTPQQSLSPDPSAPPRSRKTGGWAEELTKSGKFRANSINLIEQERFQSPEKAESDDDIPLIPDLDELQDEENISEIARAPSVGGKRVASFSELDSDLLKKSALSTLDNDINLTLLSSHLQPEEHVKEVDSTWTWDLLFTEVASDLRTEWENQAAKPQTMNSQH
ncbi:intraflagellar transport protein 43 homolog isoform X1 [Nilaparvata lugens]|uniref:intraflagellar transport protein 43 homolog isoform X1 n=1 Tax=Nilaparvata lugens TaxID=108931 RepID=UPI00193E99CC|nr:intraflagellar transport protein 43 homolog isoform X1 [Nilaparvata lugens]